MCINWGTKYGALYINRLYEMVARHTTPPFRFVCFTDSTTDVRPEVECFDLPEMPGFMPERTIGQWPKSRLWAPTLADLEGPVLFLDLDSAIVGSLDDFFDYGSPEDVILARNQAKPLHKLGQTSVYRMPVGALSSLQQVFAADPQGVADKYRFEQHFVTKNAPGGVKFWPRAWVAHFRIDCIPRFPLNYVRPPKPPNDARVVIFAGALNPPDAVKGSYHRSLPHLPPLQHIKRAWSQKKRFKAIRQYLLPAPWVQDAWTKPGVSDTDTAPRD